MNNIIGNAIGGYFELELPEQKPFLYPQALSFQSARTSFLALLHAGKPRRVWMPRYICDSMLESLRKINIECIFYDVDLQFSMVDPPDIAADDWLLYVNYFGICTENIDRLLAKFNPNQVLLDHSQAFYAPPRECLATIYSPRKFFGIPDGGLLVTSLPVVVPSQIDNGSISRSAYLLKRLAGSAESGYAEYQQAEQTLVKFKLCQMSPLTRRILMSIDFEQIRIRRNRNFRYLHERLGRINKLSINPEKIDGPLCYPFFTDKSGVKEYLISERIFVATYWPDVLKKVSESSCESLLVRNIIPLPCDQRYGTIEMKKIIDIFSKIFL